MSNLPFYILTWVLFLILRSVVIFVGLILIPPMALFWYRTTKYETSKINGRAILNWKYKLMYLWSNDEDGILAGDELKGYSSWIRIIYWTAIRNPANNLRFINGLSCKIDPNQVRFIGTNLKTINGTTFNGNLSLFLYDLDQYRFTTLTTCGPYSNLRIQFKMLTPDFTVKWFFKFIPVITEITFSHKIWRFWIGWKIYPHDKYGLAKNDYRKYGAGFATQFKRIYPR